MFRLIKLAAYAVLGYIIYELWQGMSESQGARGGRQRSMGGRGGREFESSASRSGITGGGRGMMADVAESTGAESRRPVGRGVI